MRTAAGAEIYLMLSWRVENDTENLAVFLRHQPSFLEVAKYFTFP